MDEATMEEMKAQLGLLNGKLKEQEIVNENLIRQSIRNRISEINRSAAVAVFAGVFVVLVGSAYFLTLGLPESFVVVTDVFCSNMHCGCNVHTQGPVAGRGVRFGCGFGKPEDAELQEKLQQMDYNRHGGCLSMGSMDNLPVSVDRKR